MLRNDNEIAALLPLTPVVFHILPALADGPWHDGYAIMQDVNRRSDGKVGLGPGTLYGAIQRMEDSGVLQKTAPPPGETADPRGRYYQMTELGRAGRGRRHDRGRFQEQRELPGEHALHGVFYK